MDIEKYIGLPYKDNGRDTNGIDCWGLARLFYKEQLNIELPSYSDQYIGATNSNTKELILTHRDSWELVQDPKPGDLVLFNILGEPTHIGIYLGNNQFLHVREGYDSVVESTQSGNWAKRIAGYYAYKSHGLNLIGAPHPLNNHVVKDWGVEGSTVKQVVDYIQTKYKVSQRLMERIVVAVDGIPVSKDRWQSTVLTSGQLVTYKALPGKSAARTLLTVAVMIAAAYTGGLVLGAPLTAANFAAATLGTQIATVAAVAATQMAGFALINAIAPIRPPRAPDDPGTPNSLNLFNGASNQANRFGAIPVVLGTIRYTGLLGAVPYIKSETSTSLFHSIVVWGYGPLQVEDLCVGTRTISSLYSTPYTSTEAAQTPSIAPSYITLGGYSGEDTAEFDKFYPVDVEQQYPQIELINNSILFPENPNPWATYSTSGAVDSIDITFSFPEGMRQLVVKGNNTGQINEASASVEIQLRKWTSGGSESWQSVATHYAGNQNPGGTATNTGIAFSRVLPHSWYNYFGIGNIQVQDSVEQRYSICVAPGGGIILFQGTPAEKVVRNTKTGRDNINVVYDYEDTGEDLGYRVFDPVIPSGYIEIYRVSVTGSGQPVVTDLRTNLNSYEGFSYTSTANANNSGWIFTVSSGKITSQLASQTATGTETTIFQTSEFANVVEDQDSRPETWTDFLVQNGYKTNDSSAILDRTFTKSFPVTGTYTITASGTNSLVVYVDGQAKITSGTNSESNELKTTITLTQGSHVIRLYADSGGEVAVAALKITYIATNTANSLATTSTSLIWGIGHPWSKFKDAFNDTYTLSDLTRQRYEIRVRRTNSSVSEPNDTVRNFHRVVLASITGYNNSSKPTIDPPGCKLAKTVIRLQSTNTVNGTVDGINALVSSVCKDWNGTNWNTIRATNNPASLFRWVLEHPANAYRITNEAELDLTQLQVWHSYCATNGFTFNAVITDTRSVLEVLRDICAAGKASPIYKDGKWSVVIDKARDHVVQYFTPHNSWGFESTKVLPRIPHAFRIQFLDENNSYQTKEIIVYNYGYTEQTATIFEELQFPGITNETHVKHMARWHLAQLKLRPEIYTLNTDFEYLVCNRGDLVKVAHDLPMWGIGTGRIKTISSAAGVGVLGLTESVYLETSKSYSILIRTNNLTSTANSGNIRKLIAQVPSNGYYNSITLTTAIAVQDNIEVDNLFMLGLVNNETQQLIVTNIEPLDNYSARLTLVDYSPEIYTTNLEGQLPAYSANITSRGTNTAQETIVAIPSIISLVSDSALSERVANGAYVNKLLVGFGTPQSINTKDIILTNASKIQVQIARSDQLFSGNQLSGLYEIKRTDTTLSIYGLETNTQYKLRARYTDELGSIVGPWSEIYFAFVKGKIQNTFNATSLVLDLQRTNIVVKPAASQNIPDDFKHYEFRLIKDINNNITTDFWDSPGTYSFTGITEGSYDLRNVSLPRISSAGITYKVACRAVDNTNNYSTSSVISSIVVQTIK